MLMGRGDTNQFKQTKKIEVHNFSKHTHTTPPNRMLIFINVLGSSKSHPNVPPPQLAL